MNRQSQGLTSPFIPGIHAGGDILFSNIFFQCINAQIQSVMCRVNINACSCFVLTTTHTSGSNVMDVFFHLSWPSFWLCSTHRESMSAHTRKRCRQQRRCLLTSGQKAYQTGIKVSIMLHKRPTPDLQK